MTTTLIVSAAGLIRLVQDLSRATCGNPVSVVVVHADYYRRSEARSKYEQIGEFTVCLTEEQAETLKTRIADDELAERYAPWTP